MNVTSFKTMNYEQRTMNDANKNKPNSKPIKANQTQYKPNFKGKKMLWYGFRTIFKQFEKKLVTARQSRDYLENREKDKRNKSFSFS